MSYRETQAEADARVCDADRLIGAGIVLLIAAGIAAVAVFAVPAAVWFLA